MKVYIGKYPHWYTTSNFENWLLEKCHKKPYYDVKNEDYTRFDHAVEYICDKWQIVLNATVNKIGQKRKIKVHIDDYDVWSMDHTLALIALPMLKKLKEQKHGSPYIDDEDVPEHLRSTAAPPLTEEEKTWGGTDALFHDRWVWVLDEMIYAFECEVDEDWEQQFYSGEHDQIWVKDEETGYSEMKLGSKNTFKVDREAMDKDWARRKNGLRLFGKYYHGLWD